MLPGIPDLHGGCRHGALLRLLSGRYALTAVFASRKWHAVLCNQAYSLPWCLPQHLCS